MLDAEQLALSVSLTKQGVDPHQSVLSEQGWLKVINHSRPYSEREAKEMRKPTIYKAWRILLCDGCTNSSSFRSKHHVTVLSTTCTIVLQHQRMITDEALFC